MLISDAWAHIAWNYEVLAISRSYSDVIYTCGLCRQIDRLCAAGDLTLAQYTVMSRTIWRELEKPLSFREFADLRSNNTYLGDYSLAAASYRAKLARRWEREAREGGL